MMEIRDYQRDIIEQMKHMLTVRRICYLAAEMRTGKTLMSLTVAKEFCNNILFVTKKAAIPDVENEVKRLGMQQNVLVINFEQVAKLKDKRFGLAIVDEAHSLGAFPKPALRTKAIKEICSQVGFVIYLSGTPSPESYSQLFHQFWILPDSINPLRKFKNFYAFAKEHVNVKAKMIGHGKTINDYSDCKQSGVDIFERYFIRLSQQDAGFKAVGIEEEIVYCTSASTADQINRITRDMMLKVNETEIICKNAADVFTKVHQISSGTILCDSGAFILSLHKVQELKKLLTNGKRCVIFTKFVAEEKLLLQSKYKIEEATGNIDDFQQGRAKHFISNVAKASMGVNLSMADIIVFYNLDFSSKNFIQAKARLQAYAKEEKTKIVYLFTIGGLEEKIYKSLKNKESYTLSYFKRDFQCYDREPATIEDY